MTEPTFPLDAFLDRIGADSSTATTVERLEVLQRAFAYSVPFENLDIQLGRGVSLDPDHLVDKVVHRRRGGYCFELNALMLRALQTLGFEARALLARVHLTGTPGSRTHQVSLVTIEGRDWVVDVGFGGLTPRVPMPLGDSTPRDHDGVEYRFTDHALGTMLEARPGEEWQNLYTFDRMPVVHGDLDAANYFTSTNPKSHFTQMRTVALAHPEGSTRLLNYRCTTIRGGEDTVEMLPDSADYLAELERRFGIVLDAPYESLSPIEPESA